MSSTLFPSSFNSTIVQENLLLTTTASETGNAYDHQGAALYIAVILVWYSTGLAMMLFLQVRPRSLQQQFLFDSSDSSSSSKNRLPSIKRNPFTDYRNIQADHTTKQILNELKDPDRRQRLWKIYYASREKQDEQHPQYYQTITSDSATIDRIKRKLADIHRINAAANDEDAILSPTNDNRASAASAFDSTKFFTKRFTALRRPTGNTSASGNIRPVLVRAHSQTDTPSAEFAVEMEPLVSGTQPTNGSRKRTNLFANRFTVEKVSNNKTMLSSIDKSPSSE